jgi:copper chaperone CopZ
MESVLLSEWINLKMGDKAMNIKCLVCGEDDSERIWMIPKVGPICEGCLSVIHKAIHEIYGRELRRSYVELERSIEVRGDVIEAEVVEVAGKV